MPRIEKINQIQILRVGKVDIGSSGNFHNFIDMKSWLAFALCGKENQHLLTQTSEGFENFSPAVNLMTVLPEALATLPLQVTPEIKHLIKLAALEVDYGVAIDKGANEFIVDWETSVKDYAPCIFCAKEYLDPDFDVLLNADHFELSFDMDKFSSIGDLPFFSNEFHGGSVYGVRTS